MSIPKNHGKPVSLADIKSLTQFANGNTPTPLIAYKMGRTENSIRSIASNNGISLHPTNKSPYNRIKKS